MVRHVGLEVGLYWLVHDVGQMLVPSQGKSILGTT